MHILFLTDNFPPEVNAPASRTFEHCREWVRQGHKVTVITGAPNFPRGKVYDGYKNKLFARETVEGIDVIRVWTYITANEGFLRRTLDYLSFMVSAIPAGLSVPKVDIIIGTSPQLFTPCAARIISAFKRRPYVFELRDLWPESIRAVGAMKESRVLDWLEGLELYLYRRAKHIVCVTSSFRDNLISRKIDGSKISVVLNGADLSRFQPRPRDEALAAELGLTGKTVAAYVGTHGMAHGLDTLLDAAAKLKDVPEARDIRFLFLGDGAEKAGLKARAEAQGIDNVLFVDSVSRDEVVRYWSLADVSIIHLRKTPLFETVIPSKLFECMAMGLPVLHGVSGESARIVDKEKVGRVFEPENADALAVHLLEFASNPELRAECRAACLEAAKAYDRRQLATRMLETLTHVVADEGRAGAALPSTGAAMAQENTP